MLEFLQPQIALLHELRRSTARTEASTFRDLLQSKEAETAIVIQALLGVDNLHSDFSAHYSDTLAVLNRVLTHWETWAGDLSKVRLHDRNSFSRYWKEEAKVLDFGQIQYSFASPGNVSLSILPPFVHRIGAGIDKLDPDYREEESFVWDVGLPAPPGTSAEVAAEGVAKLIPVLTDLQHEVALQLGTKWIRYYLIESMLRAEISTAWFNGNPEAEVFVNGLARLYLDHFIRLTEPERVAILFPNLIHFPVDDISAEQLESLFHTVETLDPFEPPGIRYQTATSRVLMLGLLKASQSVEGKELPMQRFDGMGIEIPDGGFNSTEFAKAVQIAYPQSGLLFAEAAHEVAALMRKNALPQNPEKEEYRNASSVPKPLDYHSFVFGDLKVQAPASLKTALAELAPEWSNGLESVAEILRSRYEARDSVLLTFKKADFASLAEFGIHVSEKDVAPWIRQTEVSSHLEKAFLALFDQPRLEVWFEDDLANQLRENGNTEQYVLDPKTGKVGVNFSLRATLPPLPDVSPTHLTASSPPFPVILSDSEVANFEKESQIAAIREGDLLIQPLIADASKLSVERFSSEQVSILEEEESFFVVVHEAVEGYLIQEVIGSPDRRWFCDGLANWIAVQECDRRYGRGTGDRVLEEMFPSREGSGDGENIDPYSWKALEYTPTASLSKIHENEGPLYRKATHFMSAALKGRDASFVKRWLEAIQKTNWVRTNASTVLSAYTELTGKDFRDLSRERRKETGITSPSDQPR